VGIFAEMAAVKRRGDIALLNVLSRKVRVRRAELGWKQYELAQRAGLSPQYIAQIEGGQVPSLPVVTLTRLCAVLGKTPDEMLGYEDTSLEVAG
jgi:transcriptional regulator with XRE-family HTH domain